jgi:hypothetical protein
MSIEEAVVQQLHKRTLEAFNDKIPPGCRFATPEEFERLEQMEVDFCIKGFSESARAVSVSFAISNVSHSLAYVPDALDTTRFRQWNWPVVVSDFDRIAEGMAKFTYEENVAFFERAFLLPAGVWHVPYFGLHKPNVFVGFPDEKQEIPTLILEGYEEEIVNRRTGARTPVQWERYCPAANLRLDALSPTIIHSENVYDIDNVENINRILSQAECGENIEWLFDCYENNITEYTLGFRRAWAVSAFGVENRTYWVSDTATGKDPVEEFGFLSGTETDEDPGEDL